MADLFEHSLPPQPRGELGPEELLGATACDGAHSQPSPSHAARASPRIMRATGGLGPCAVAAYLCRHHWAGLLASARSALAPSMRHQAPDVVADVLAGICHGRFPALTHSEVDVLAYAAGIIRNQARHVNRTRGREADLRPHVSSKQIPEPVRLALRVWIGRDVLLALDRLTPREREVATLHWVEEWSDREIADASGTSVSTVRELLRRARRKLRESLRPYSPDADTPVQAASPRQLVV